MNKTEIHNVHIPVKAEYMVSLNSTRISQFNH